MNNIDPQKLARLTGLLFLITYATSIPPFILFYVPIVGDPNYVVGAGADLSVSWGAFFEMLLIIANVGTAVALYPVLKRVNEALALGYVTARLVECMFIAVGILSLLAVVTLRQEAAGADAGPLLAVGKALVAVHGWTFMLGPGFVVGVGNGLILGYLMYKSRLVPRGMAMLGLVGGPLIVLHGTAIIFGIVEPGSVWQGVATMPEFLWELFLGIWLLLRGFNPTALASLPANPADGASAGTRSR